MDAPQSELYPEPRVEALVVLFRIISHRSWDELQALAQALPGSSVEHVLHGIYVLHVPPGGARELAA